MKRNILVVGFLGELNDRVCKKLSDDLGMFYANVADMVAYELTNADEMITVCGLDYYQQQEEKVLKRLSSFDDTIFCFEYSYFVNFAKKYFSQTCHIIYLKVSEKKLELQIRKNNDIETWSSAIDVIDFDQRNQYLQNLSDVVIECDRLCFQSYCKKIKEYLKSLYM